MTRGKGNGAKETPEIDEGTESPGMMPQTNPAVQEEPPRDDNPVMQMVQLMQQQLEQQRRDAKDQWDLMQQQLFSRELEVKRRDNEAKQREDQLQQQLQLQQRESKEREDLLQQELQRLNQNGRGAGGGAGTTANSRSKKVDIPNIGPPNSVTLSEFKDYKRRVKGYRNLQKLDTDMDAKGRMQLVSLGIDKEWLDLHDGKNKLIVDEENDDLDGMLDKMRAYLRLHRNPLLDRLTFLARNQRAGERIDEYYAALRLIDNDCDFEEKLVCRTCNEDSQLAAVVRDERLRDRVICGLENESIRQKILAEDFSKLTLTDVLNRGRNEESALSTSSMLGEPAKVNAVKSAYQKKKLEVHKQRRETDNSESQGTSSKECWRCGRETHKPDKCPSRGLSCMKCGKEGHLRRMCPDKPVQQVGAVYVNAVVEEEQLVNLTMVVGENFADIGWVIDTGASANIISLKELKKLGMNQKDLCGTDISLKTADRKELDCVGMLKATILRNEEHHDCKVYVVAKLNAPILSKQASICLQFLPENFPYTFVEKEEEKIPRGERSVDVEAGSHQKEEVKTIRPGESIIARAVNGSLVIMDNFSGWAQVYRYAHKKKKEETSDLIRMWMVTFGVPRELTVEGEPQEEATRVSHFCRKWGIEYKKADPNRSSKHKVTSLAETIKRVSTDLTMLRREVLEYCNTPGSDGKSPAQKLFGRAVNRMLPLHPPRYRYKIQSAITKLDKSATSLKAKAAKQSTTKQSDEDIRQGDIVRVQHKTKGDWNLVGEVVEADRQKFLVKTETGRLYRRDKEFLKMTRGADSSEEVSATRSSVSH